MAAWTVEPPTGIGHCEVKRGNHGAAIIVANIGKYDEADSDARLIAAAPDLLEALKRFASVAVWDDDTDRNEFDAAFAQVELAIAKAEGR